MDQNKDVIICSFVDEIINNQQPSAEIVQFIRKFDDGSYIIISGDKNIDQLAKIDKESVFMINKVKSNLKDLENTIFGTYDIETRENYV
jgi:hypothetical protein